MAFADSISSGWDPLWKGLGMEPEEELPAPDSFGSDFDNSIKKRVSFASPTHSRDQGGEVKKGWKWRRKQRKSTKSSRKRQQRKLEEDVYLDEYSPEESFDSFEERAMEHRDEDDENLDDDLWEGSDTREDEDHGVASLWTSFFNFGQQEKDFDDGWTEGEWTEGDSTFVTDEGTATASVNSQEVKRASSAVSSLDSNEEGEETEGGEEIELVTSNDSKRVKNDEAQAPPPCFPTGGIEWNQAGGFVNSSKPTAPVATGKTSDDLSEPHHEARGASSENSGDSTEPEKTAVEKKKKKKKIRWKVGRGRSGRSRSSKSTAEKATPPAKSLDPISEEQRDDVAPAPSTKFAIDEGDSGISHKSCMPVLFNERAQQRRNEPIGKLLCKSHASPFIGNQTSVSVASDLTSQATPQVSVPMVRIISDVQGNQGPTVAGKRSVTQKSEIKRQMQLEESHFASSKGPQSIYTYEYDKGTPMDVRYKEFGDDAEEVVKVRDYVVPMTLLPGSSDVIVKVEASTISLSDCRIRQGNWWGLEESPLPNTPGVDMVGTIDSIDDRTRRKYKLKPGDRVISLVLWGGNSRYLRIKADQLVKVPKGVDPVEATCLAETYLAAFQALQYSQSSWARYSSQSLIGKSVLVIGGMTNTGHAVIELAVALGAMDVYATAKGRHRSTLDDLGATPIERKPKLWPPEVLGTMDIVIDATGDVEGDHANVSHFNALHDQGNLIFIGLRDMTDAVAREWDVTSTLLDTVNTDDLVNRTHSLEVFDNWELDLDRSKNDLEYLMRLLEQELIKPVVRDVLPLSKVARAQTLLETRRVEGYLVCEPWIKSKSRAVYL